MSNFLLESKEPTFIQVCQSFTTRTSSNLCWLQSISVPKMSANDVSTTSFSLQSTHRLDNVKGSFVIVSFLILERICSVASTGMDIELHGDELDNAGRREGDVGKRTMQEAKEQQIEREAEPVGCPTAGPHLEHILRCEPE